MPFGWDLKSFWLTTHQKRCQAFLLAGKVEEALESHQHMIHALDETKKASCLDWFNDFKEQCSGLAARDDRILGAEIPGQDQDGYDVEPDFFRGMHAFSNFQTTTSAAPGALQKAQASYDKATLPPAAAPMTFKAHVRHLFTWRPDRAAPPVVEVPFAWGRQRHAAGGAPPDDDSDIMIRADSIFRRSSTGSQYATAQYTTATTTSSNAGRHWGTWRWQVVFLLLAAFVDVLGYFNSVIALVCCDIYVDLKHYFILYHHHDTPQVLSVSLDRPVRSGLETGKMIDWERCSRLHPGHDIAECWYDPCCYLP
ncbi:hypothetical protein DEU56DRAFT_536217 [Suillus clintonianus]|uniref:uncharacterized protein n=1 Tax=Suillus clintonianus TaxID=1904413 RepID=UPI001B870733|nr:uncharacterized protein DEU56DRAFT_536217 [Suillus clintonianus]KAG2126811.1 hypothetical protein DEU56DRAFT_536217 [Suillus clintonianus]